MLNIEFHQLLLFKSDGDPFSVDDDVFVHQDEDDVVDGMHDVRSSDEKKRKKKAFNCCQHVSLFIRDNQMRTTW